VVAAHAVKALLILGVPAPGALGERLNTVTCFFA